MVGAARTLGPTTIGGCSARRRCRMPRQWWRSGWQGPLALALTVLGTLGVLAPPAPAHAATARTLDPQQPLVPRIRTITPNYVPDQGPIVVTGTVTNVSDQTWTAINVHGFMGDSPLTTTAELALPRRPRSTPTSATGSRSRAPSTASPPSHPGRPDPSRSGCPARRCRCRRPASTGSASTCSATTARAQLGCGRTRPHVPPLVPASAIPANGHEDAALVLPLRAGVTRAADGSISGSRGVAATSLRTGPLHAVVRTARAAQGRPLTWLVDPAVPDVVRRLAHGNPTRTLTAPSTSGTGPSSPSPSDSPSDRRLQRGGLVRRHRSPRPRRPGDGSASCGPSWPPRPLSCSGLPYGDLAVDSAARFDRPLLPGAFRRTGHALRPWGLPLTRVVSPPERPDRRRHPLATCPHDTDVLLADSGVTRRRLRREPRRRPPRSCSPPARRCQGGPGPVDAAELARPASARAGRGGRSACSTTSSRSWSSCPRELQHPLHPSFFNGLDVPWLRLTTLDGRDGRAPATPRAPRPCSSPRRTSPSSEPASTTPPTDVLGSGSTLQSVLSGNHVLRRRSCSTRRPATRRTRRPRRRTSRSPGCARPPPGSTTTSTRSTCRRRESVTLASDSGRFSAIVSNELDVPVTVKVRAIADREVDDHRRREGTAAPARAHLRPAACVDPRTRRPQRHPRADQPGRAARSARTTRSRCAPSR